MNLSKIAIAALSLSALSVAFADDADRSGQFANSVAPTQVTRTQVQAQLNDYRQAGVNPWSTSYNPLKAFKSERTRAEVQAEYIAARDAVSALTGEDSGSAYLATTRPAAAATRFAGQPVNAQ